MTGSGLIPKVLTAGSRSLARGALALVTASVASAQIVPGSYRSGDILVEAPWSRASPGGAKVASGYMRITNVGPLPDRLIGGSAAVAGGFEVHLSTVVDGIARMEPVTDGLEIKPGETVELRPGGAHGMLVDLQRPLKKGGRVSERHACVREGRPPRDRISSGGHWCQSSACGRRQPAPLTNKRAASSHPVERRFKVTPLCNRPSFRGPGGQSAYAGLVATMLA